VPAPTAAILELPLRGPGGEPVDLRRTVASHGLVDLPPMRPLEGWNGLELTVRPLRGRPRTLVIEPSGPGVARVRVLGRAPGAALAEELLAIARHVLRLDDDLSGFYAHAAEDPELAWAARIGAGRLIRGQTVFEDVVKTICTTNCAWSGTVRMVGALVGELGEAAPGAPPEGPLGRAFPTPEAMAAAPASFYTDVARAGYRGAYLRQIAADVAEGRLDLEAMDDVEPGPAGDDLLEERLLALPGVGPYAAAHVMMLLGRHSRLVLDSWTRPKYTRTVGAKRALKDATIVRRFRRYREHAGLAFWLTVTRDWLEDPPVAPPPAAAIASPVP
jgi:3-methyladenine DNA glycosylase/8-oxoguanine DNA glycosylase